MRKKTDLIREEAKKCYGELLNYAKFKFTSNHHDAEDLVSQAYLRFFNSYDKGRSNYKVGTNILGYLKLIVTNINRDKYRKKKRSPEIISENKLIDNKEVISFDEYKSQKLNNTEYNLTDPFASNMDAKEILKIMDNILSQEDREIFTLIMIEDYKYSEVAKKLKIPQGTIGSKLNRSLQKIREELEQKNVLKLRK